VLRIFAAVAERDVGVLPLPDLHRKRRRFEGGEDAFPNGATAYPSAPGDEHGAEYLDAVGALYWLLAAAECACLFEAAPCHEAVAEQ
jgi:hypothetical protein